MFKKYIFSILFNTNEKTKISISIRRIQTNPNNLFFRDIHLDNSIYRKTDVSVSGRKVKNRSVSHQWHRCRSRNSFLWFIRDRSGACFGRRRILEGRLRRNYSQGAILLNLCTRRQVEIFMPPLSSCVQTARGPPHCFH